MYLYTQRVDTSCPLATVLQSRHGGKRTRVHNNIIGTDLRRDRQKDDGGYIGVGWRWLPSNIYMRFTYSPGGGGEGLLMRV